MSDENKSRLVMLEKLLSRTQDIKRTKATDSRQQT